MLHLLLIAGRWRSRFSAAPQQPLIPATGEVPTPPRRPASAPKTLDLGAGYTLVLNAADGKIVPPAQPDTRVKRTDLGAGYLLEETAYGARIIAPAVPQAQPAVQQTYLGAGYWLVNGQIVPPGAPKQVQPVKKMDLGGGYWLVTGPDGGQIVCEGSR